MANLLDLPDEVISLVFSRLIRYRVKHQWPPTPDFKQPDLVAAALLCHRTRLIVRHILFHCTTLMLSTKPLFRKQSAPDLFLRSLRTDLTLGALVRSLRLFVIDFRPEIAQKLKDILDLLPNVQKLAVLTLCATDIEEAWSPVAIHKLLAKVPLSDVTIRDRMLTADDIFRYMSLDTIRYITIPVDYSAFRWNPSNHLTLRERTSPILELRIRPSLTIAWSMASLSTLLSFPKSLRSLECPLPEQHYSNSDESHSRKPFSPAKLSQALFQLCDSLVDLRLIKRQSRSPRYRHDGTRLDLTAMRALRNISVHSDCFFLPGTAFGSRSRISNLLPFTVESLEIDCDEADGLRHFLATSIVDEENSNAHRDSSIWILDLARVKNLQTPRLTQLIVNEMSPHLFRDVREDYNLLLQLQSWPEAKFFRQEFEMANIYFNGRLANKQIIEE